MSILEDTTCCGVDEINGLEKKPLETLLAVCRDKYDAWSGGAQHAFIIFTDTMSSRRGVRLAEYITEHKLGVLYKTEKAKRNPNSGNRIMVWIWSPNERELKKWWKKNDPEASSNDDDNY